MYGRSLRFVLFLPGKRLNTYEKLETCKFSTYFLIILGLVLLDPLAIPAEEVTGTSNADEAASYYDRGVSLVQEGKYEEAITALSTAAKIAPDNPDVYIALGGLFGMLEREKEAEETFKKLISLRPDSAEAHYLLGVLYCNTNRYEEELEQFKEAVRLKPAFIKAYVALGIVYKGLDMPQEAEKVFREAITISTADAESYYYRVLAYLELN